MEHTSRIYVVDKGGRLRLTFPFGMDVEAMTEDIVRLIEEEL
jgi:cytochrome oxidase Cu insertion factor (SCO1/SenC/PrrC family)